MKNKLLNNLKLYFFVIAFSFIHNISLGQSPPLGTTSSFALFTAAGAFTNVGVSTFVTGDVGTNVGAFTAFPPGTLVGNIHVADGTSASAATAVAAAYSYLSGLTCGSVLGTTLGSGQTLTPNIYCLGAASSLTGNLILDGQGDPNALFIFQIDGALSTSTLSNVILTNSASLCNVYWQINGAFSLGDGSVFRGTVVAAGQIELSEGSSLLGRGLTTAGAILLHNNMVALGTQTTATITASGNATICSGNSVTLTASSDGVGPFSYLWSPGGQTDSSITVSPTVTTTYSVAITAMNGCSDGTDTIVVTVNPLPTVTANASATTVCAGASVTLTGGGATTYVWTGGVTDGVSFIPASTNTYTVTGTDANNCSDTASIVVNVNPLPTVTANASASTVCEGTSVTLTGGGDSGTLTGGATTYVWTGGVTDGVGFIPSSTTTYTVTGTDANNCSASDTIRITILPILTVDLGNDTTVTLCTGHITLDADNSGMAYSWSTGASTQTINVSTTGTYYVDVNNSGICTASDTINVTVIPGTLTIELGNDTLINTCKDDSILLDAGVTNAIYSWSTGQTTQTIFVTTTAEYYVDVTDSEGCSDSDTITVEINNSTIHLDLGTDTTVCGCITLYARNAGASFEWSTGDEYSTINVCTSGEYWVTVNNGNCIASDTIVVTINPTPVVNLGADLTLDFGGTMILDAGNSGSTYLWNTGETTKTIMINSSGIYSVLVTNAYQCAASDTIEIIVGGQGVAMAPTNLILSSQKTNVKGEMNLSWKDNSTNEDGFIIERSIDNSTFTKIDSISSNTTAFIDKTGIPIINNYYRVCAYNSAGNSAYSNTVNGTTLSTTGIYRISEINNVSIYPNPTIGIFTIEFGGMKNASVKIMNMLGEVIYYEKLSNSTSQKISLLKDAPIGVYIIELQAEDKTYYKKLIKE